MARVIKFAVYLYKAFIQLGKKRYYYDSKRITVLIQMVDIHVGLQKFQFCKVVYWKRHEVITLLKNPMKFR